MKLFLSSLLTLLFHGDTVASLEHNYEGFEMVTKSKQVWTFGAVVKVGFLSLRITGIKGSNDYQLESLDGAKRYEFTPHCGLIRI